MLQILDNTVVLFIMFALRAYCLLGFAVVAVGRVTEVEVCYVVPSEW